ncbi:MAG: CcmD family protein [Chloroflexi bacterium]|nr:CcmD family protein [Chloroflexota bacterium]
MDNLVYVFVAYTVIWAAVFAYLITIGRAQADLRRQIDSLKEALKEKGGG